MPQRADDFVAELQRRISALESQVKTLQSAPRLRHASLDDAPLPVKDRDGQVVQVIGRQSDGSFGNRVIKAGPQPVPTRPVVRPGVGTLQVTWDGRADHSAVPDAFGRVDVMLESPDGGTPEHVSSIYSRSGGSTTVRATPGRWTVRLRMVGPDGETVSRLSGAAQATVEVLVDESDIRARIEAFAGGELEDAAYSALMARLGEFLIVRAGQIEANAIEAMHIAGGAIDGQVITGATVQTQQHPQRGTKMTDEGFVGYSDSGSVTVWIDGEQVRLSAPSTIIEGDVQARSLALQGVLSVGTSGEGRLAPATGGRLRIEGRVPNDAGPRDTFTTSSTPYYTPGTGLNSTTVTYDQPTPVGVRVPIVTPNLSNSGSVDGLIACSTRNRTESGFTVFTQRLFTAGNMPRVSLSYLATWGAL